MKKFEWNKDMWKKEVILEKIQNNKKRKQDELEAERLKYEEDVKCMQEMAESEFSGKELEDGEELKQIVSSDIAYLALSNKKAYFRGEYLGVESEEDKRREIPLEDVSHTRVGTGFKKEKIKKMKVWGIVLAVLAAICMILQIVHAEMAKKLEKVERQYYTLEANDPNDIIDPNYTVWDVLEYVTAKESGEPYTPDPYLDAREERAEEYDRQLHRAQSAVWNAESDVEDVETARAIALVILGIVGIAAVVHAVKLSKYQILWVYIPNKRYGIEVKNNEICDIVKKIVDEAKPVPVQNEAVHVMPSQTTPNVKSKLERLKELSEVYELGILTEEEFKRLKGEILELHI